MTQTLLRWLARPYLALYDLAMVLGAKWGPVVLGYGPIALAIAAFLLKAQSLDRWMDPGTATVGIFVVFALCGPLMHIGTKIVTENLHRARQGRWPASADIRFNRDGPISPTMHWVNMVRDWSRDSV